MRVLQTSKVMTELHTTISIQEIMKVKSMGAEVRAMMIIVT